MKLVDKVLNTMGLQKKGMGPTKADTTFWKTLRMLKGLDDSTDVEDPYKKSVWVYSSINAIATNIGSVPFRLYTTKTKDKKSIVEEGLLYDLFTNPNPYYTENLLKQATVTYLEVYGEAFWVFEGRENITQIPTEIYPMNPTRFEPVFVSTKEGKLFSGYWRYLAPDTTPDNSIIFAPHQILHIRYFNPYDDIRGLSPIEASRMGVNQDYFSSKFNENFFKDGAAIGGVIEVEDTLNQNEFELLRMQFEDRHKGYDKAHKVAVLTGGASFREVKMSQRDMEFISLKTVTRGEILAAFKTNEVVLGNYENIQCLSPDTEILTDKGFVHAPNVKVGDLVATLDANGNATFKPITKVYESDYTGEMYTQKKVEVNGRQYASRIDFLVTPKHKMYGKERISKYVGGKYKSDFMFKRICDIESNSFVAPRNATWSGKIVENYNIGKNTAGIKETVFPIVPWLKFLGWFISEGCFKGDYELTITQVKKEGRDKIREDLKDFPYSYNEYDGKDFVLNGKELSTYLLNNVGRYCYEKRIPRDILNLHPELLQYLFGSLMAGDGTKVKERFTYSTTSKQLANDVYELAIKLGMAPTIYGGEEGLLKTKGRFANAKPIWIILIPTKKDSSRMAAIKPEVVEYTGTIHCIEVPPYHTMMTRYNGKVMWTGNSYEGIRQSHMNFWRETLVPKMLYMEDVLWSKFFSKIQNGNIWGGFDLSGVQALQEDYNAKVKSAEILSKIGIPINEISKRLDLGFPEYSWGNVWWIPLNMIPATEAMNRPTNPEEDPEGDTEPTIEEPTPGPAEGTDDSPTDDDTDDTVVDDKPVKESAMWERYIWIQSKFESEYKSKLKKYFFEQRKAVLQNLSKDNLIDREKEIQKLQKIFNTMYLKSAKAGIEMIYNELDVEYKSDDIPESIKDSLEKRKNKISSQIVDGVNRILIGILEKSVEEEDSVDVLAKKIREMYNRFSGKINTIARCESAAILNTARFFTMAALGVKKHKWISRKEGGRILHKEYNKKTVDIGKSFDSEFSLLFPTYYKAPLKETINCLCVTIPII